MPRMLGYPRLVQLELFRPPPQRPIWEQIPPEARQKTIFLLAKMLGEHRIIPRADRREAPCE